MQTFKQKNKKTKQTRQRGYFQTETGKKNIGHTFRRKTKKKQQKNKTHGILSDSKQTRHGGYSQTENKQDIGHIFRRKQNKNMTHGILSDRKQIRPRVTFQTENSLDIGQNL